VRLLFAVEASLLNGRWLQYDVCPSPKNIPSL
jgi:hypothetical protein